jgi:signal transduction histidine kinase
MTQTPEQVPPHRGFPELAQALCRASDGIVQQFIEALRSEVPESRKLAEGQIIDDLPRLLQVLATSVETGEAEDIRTLLDESPEHGGVRFRQQFDLRTLIHEYALLRPLIVRRVVNELRRDMTLEELITLGRSLDAMITLAVLDHAELQEAYLRAESAAMAKYLSFLSHDLRGGLNSVILMIEVLKRDLSGEARLAPLLEDLDSMRRGVLDTVGTMDRFLNAERMRRGKMPVKIETIDLVHLGNDLARGYAYQLREQGLELQLQLPEQASVQSDPDLIGMVLQNLLGNAIKYGRQQIILRVARLGEGKQGWRVSVIDQGPGIPQTKLQELFSPFSRGETYGQKGLGLGLYIARHAADLLGARLLAESEVGTGTSFHLDL